jgi:serine/threonine-protein kinase
VDTRALNNLGDLPRGDEDDDKVITREDRAGVHEGARPDTARSYPVGAVLGSYRLLQQIGAGGMGRVFVAEHVRLGRRVALKVLRSEFSGNLEAVKRFFDEARAVNCISHENIIEVSDFVESRHGPSFYIMELLHGHDLRGVQERDGVLAMDRILRIGAQICSGLGAAHAAGIVHRDLKPDNIFLIERGAEPDFVKLLDFGVAKLSSTADEASTFRSSVGMVVGTPDYMAPEQAMGHPVDHRADIYATGVILYEMVAGRRPFVANSAREVMVQHLTAAPCRPSMLNPAGKIPEDLEELILACLAKEPSDRPQSIKEVEMRLRAIRDELPARDRLAASRRAWRRQKPLKLAGAAALLAVLATSVWLGSGSLFASTPSIAAAGARLRARIGGNRGVPAAINPSLSRSRSRSAFTIEPQIDASGGKPATVLAPSTAPPAIPAAPAPARSLAAPPEKPPTPQEKPAPPQQKIVRKPSTATVPTTQPPAFNERAHPRLDRDLVLDPFE